MTNEWTAFLATQGARIDDSGARVALPPADGAATVLVPLLHLGLIHSQGAESAPFLHNLFSNDVKKLAPEAAQWNSFNSPKGRMLASFLLWGTPEAHWLAMSADLQPALLKKLSMYVLRSKVKLQDAGTDHALLGLAGPEAAERLSQAGLPVPDAPMQRVAHGGGNVIRLDARHFVLAFPVAEAIAIFNALQQAGAHPAGTDAWQLAMIRAGLPLVTTATQEEFVAQMLNYELIGGVSFNKGCYPGQEIVARTRYLGKLKKRMYRVHIDGASAPAPTPGADLYAPDFGDQSAGKLVNVAPCPEGGFEALAVLQMSSAEAGEVHLASPDGPRLRLLELPYALNAEAAR